MTDRKGVLVRFGPNLPASLDAKAKEEGISRTDAIVIAAQAWVDGGAGPRLSRPPAGKRPAKGIASGLDLPVGPMARKPGSMLLDKKGRGR